VTPAVVTSAGGKAEVIVPGAYSLSGYSAEDGERLWWIRDGSWQPKSTPIVDGDMIYVNSWEGGGGASPGEVQSFETLLEQANADGDGKISEPELLAVEPKLRFYTTDLDSYGLLDARDWDFYRARKTSRSELLAIRHGARGDLTDTEHIVWRLDKFLPNVPSPLLYDGVIYLVKDGGIVTSLDAKTGEILKQGRLREALDAYYASPVAADGKVYMASQGGVVSVLRAGREWEILASNEFGEEIFGTPAIVDDRIYLRTKQALYCFAEQAPAAASGQ
jgi:outer membrane protein assembly factor BamB